MSDLTYTQFESINLKTNKDYDEKWVQARIVENPDILNISKNLSVIGVEHKQNNGGRLDVLLEDSDTEKRYTVEIQLGAVDEAHIIRTIEYWDNERNRNPHIDHTAVIVAEDITSRFLNVISLFHKSIPLIAIQMQAYRIDDKITLIGTKVLDSSSTVGEDVKADSLPADRNYWVKRSSEDYLKLADSVLELIKEYSGNDKISLNYTKPYIGLASNGVSDNFITFFPKRNAMNVSFKMDKNENSELIEQLQEMEFFRRYSNWGSVDISLNKDDFKKYKDKIDELIKVAIKSSKNR